MRKLTCLMAAALLLAAPAAQAQQEPQTLTIGVVSDPVTLDPAFMGSFFEIYAQYLMHEPLLAITTDLEVAPGLASFEMVDDTTYNFTLREGLTFHDGTPLDAAAAKWNFDRMLDPDTGSPRKSDLGPVESVEVTGPLTFTVKLSEPYAPFPHVLTNRGGMMVSQQAVEEMGEDFATQAVGAGPFKVVSWTKNDELVLEKFDNYWREGEPKLDRVVVRPLPDGTVRLQNLRSGTIQLIDSVPPQNFASLDADLEKFERPGVGFNAFSMNVTRAPFNDKRVRQALVHAVDPNVIQQAVFFNTGRPAAGPISPPLAFAHDADFAPYAYDPKKSKALLAEAGHTDPVPFEITVINSPITIRMAEIIQAQAAQAGFAPTIKQIDGASLIVVLRAKDFDLSWSPWSGRSDPDGNMYNWFTIGGPNNFAGYESEEVDALMREARTTTDQAKRGELYRKAEALIAEDAPMLFVHFDAILQATADGLSYTQRPDGSFHLSDATFQ
ncbi:MAG: ABC transporter substrate-binding protein [Pseudomonadota bacterium]